MDLATRELRRLTRLRMQMVEAHPFWGYLLLQVRLVPSPQLPALTATDAIRHIWFNPRFTAQLPDEELGFVITHLLVHQVFAMQQRRGNRDARRWHQATDYSANQMVAAITDPADYSDGALYTPPNRTIEGLGEVTTLLDERFDGLIVESIYEHLKADDSEEGGGPGEGGGDGAEADLLSDAVEVDVTTFEGTQRVGFRGIVNHNGGFDLHLPFTLDAEDRETLADRVAEAVEHWTASGGRGDTPGDLLLQLGALAQPQVPWQRVLHRFLDEAMSKSEYSRRRPNRRYLVDDLVVPGLIGDEIEHLVIALDVSGSMTPQQLRTALAEIRGIVHHAAEVTCIIADCEVHDVLDLEGVDALLRRPSVRGGGGTSHLPVFAYIEGEGLLPTVFIGLTDLRSVFPDEPPLYPVLWVTPPEHAAAPWGQVITMN